MKYNFVKHVRPRKVLIHINISPEDYAKLETLANKNEIKVPAVAREILTVALKEIT